MNTLSFTVAVLLSALPVAVLAQTLLIPSPVLPAVPHREQLRLKFTVGKTLSYTLVEDTEGSYREPGGKLTLIKSHLELKEHEKVSDLRETDQAGLIDFGIDSLTATVDQKPQSAQGDPQVMAGLAELIVLPTGKLDATIVNPAFNADEVLTGEDPAHMNPLSALGELPPEPVKVGDTWKSSVFLGMVGEKTAADLTLTAWETKEGVSIAVIKQNLRGTFKTPKGDAAHPAPDLDIQGWSAGTRTLRLSVDTGIIESADSVVLMTVLLTPRDSEGKITQLPTRMWVKVTSKLTRTDAPVLKNAATP